MWKWSSVQVIEAMALVTAWSSLRTASKSQSASEAAPPPPQINVTFESLWSAFMTVLEDKIAERLGWVLIRPVKDRRTRVEWSERKWRLPMFGRKACGQVRARTVGKILSSMGAKRKSSR
jgi:hypothetical protein